MFFNKVPLAWLNLLHSKKKLMLSIVGVTFAIVIMFVEVGFYLTFFDSNTALIRKFNADLVMLNKAKESLLFAKPFSRTQLYRAFKIEGVDEVHPLYIDRKRSLWKNGQHQVRSIRSIAFDIDKPALKIPEIYKQREKLKLPNTVLLDKKSRRCYGLRPVGTTTELAQRHVQIVGDFCLGPDFANHGNILMSDKNFALFFERDSNSEPILDSVSIGLIQINFQYNTASVKENLQQNLPKDIVVYTLAEFIEREKAFWQKTSPVGPIFLMGTVAGFLVGIIICYQILYSSVMSYLKQFATIKAFGFKNVYLLKIVLQEALFLSLLGFTTALITTRFITGIISARSSIHINVNFQVTSIIFFLAVIMCIVAGIMAAKRAFLADPADLF